MRSLLMPLLALLCMPPVLTITDLSAQEISQKSVRKAERYFINARFDEAAALYSEIAEKVPQNFDYNFKAGVSWFYSINAHNKLKALPYLEAAHKVNTPDTVPELYYYLGRTYHLADRFDDAIFSYSLLRSFIQTYSGDTVDLNEIRHYIEMAENAKKMVKEPMNVTIRNMGAGINSPYMDYAPALPADESFIVFTSRREGTVGGKKDDDDLYFEDIYIARKGEGKWQQAQNIGNKINSKKHDASVAVSADGKRLYLYKAHDIWVSTREGDSWSKPVKLLPDVNSRSYEPSITLSTDEKTIYFVSERKGGQGGKDIWKSTKLENGRWSPAENLGPAINTPFDEDSPFLTANGQTLYFSSQGHSSMGGYDIFKATLENGKWSAPHNLGYPINSSWDDIFYVLSRNSGNAYYSTIRNDTYGDLDIYMIAGIDTIPPERKKNKVRLIFVTSVTTSMGAAAAVDPGTDTLTWTEDPGNGILYVDSLELGKSYSTKTRVKGTGTDRKIDFTLPRNATGPFYQEIVIEDIKDNAGKVTGVKTIIYSAFFNIDSLVKADTRLSQLPPREAYAQLVRSIDTNATGLNFTISSFTDKVTDVLASSQEDHSQEQGRDNQLDSTRFAPVSFEFEKAQITAEAAEVLNNLYEYLSASENAKLEIHGHTDSKGSETYNIELSKRRASAAMTYLRNKGIKSNRMKIIAHGEDQPIAPNENPDGSDNPPGRDKNRRVQFIIITPR